MNTTMILLAVLAVVLVWAVTAYNALVQGRYRVRESFSDIDVQLKRRYNLVPNLVEAVKAYAAHEKGIFEKVAEARARAMGAAGVEEKAQAENMLSQTLKSLFAIAENYPDLKASDRFGQLMEELRDTEDKIQAARRFYNTNVMSMNTRVDSFPVNLIAGLLGFSREEFFTIKEEGERSVPKVAF